MTSRSATRRTNPGAGGDVICPATELALNRRAGPPDRAAVDPGRPIERD
jgi:hypothetical protein